MGRVYNKNRRGSVGCRALNNVLDVLYLGYIISSFARLGYLLI